MKYTLDDLLSNGVHVGIFGSAVYNPKKARDIDVCLIVPIGLHKKIRAIVRDVYERAYILRNFVDSTNPTIAPKLPLHQSLIYENLSNISLNGDSSKIRLYESLLLYGQVFPNEDFLKEAFYKKFGPDFLKDVFKDFLKRAEWSIKPEMLYKIFEKHRLLSISYAKDFSVDGNL
ncbi:MAG: hypothetical protein QXK37_04020 [Candidatus Woesearchaeota archaeon]